MTSTMQKNILAVLLIIASIALLITGVFSFFSDRGTATAVGQVGTVEIDVDDGIVIDVDMPLSNINPGDHDFDLATYLGYDDWDDAGTSITEGSKHYLSLHVANAGNKSVKIRNTIDLLVEFADPDYKFIDDVWVFLTTEENREADGAKELAKKYYLFEDGNGDIVPTLYFPVDGTVTTAGYYTVDALDSHLVLVGTNISECVGVRYVVFDPDEDGSYVLQGVGGAEAENIPSIDGTVTEKDFEYYLGLRAEADNRYQGATININWSVEAIQNRNTDATNAWTKIASATISGTAAGKVPNRTEGADGNIIP